MSTLAIFFWLLNAVLDTIGQLAFKAAAVTVHDTEWQRWKAMLSRPVLWLGIACFVFEFLAWLALLSLVPLSYAMLIGSINVVVLMLAGKWLFNERLDRMRVAGMWLIALGVALAGAGA
jgi:drug/metabolite transporter (DMT)-like permease